MKTYKLDGGNGSFTINGFPYVSEAYRLTANRSIVSIYPLAGTGNFILNNTPLNQILNRSGSPYTEVKNLIADFDYYSKTGELQNQIILTQDNIASRLSDPIESTKEYFIDGIIDLSGLEINIEIPAGGIEMKGYSFDTSKLICSDDDYDLFTSPVGGSGNVLGTDLAFEITGANSKVYDIVSNTGFEAIEMNRVNYNDCSSLGIIDNYRQGLEEGTGRFGGKPELTLKGIWVGGFIITTSIVRSLADGVYTLFKAGTGFVMYSRFKTNMNVDLPASASFIDFTQANFVNPSTFQLNECIITRAGIFDVNDSNILTNILKSELAAKWTGNTGIENTFVGGQQFVTAEIETVISTVDTWYNMLGTWTPQGMEHFDSPSNGQLRHLGISPIEFRFSGALNIEGTANKDLSVKLVKWNDELSQFDDVSIQSRQVNNLVGGRDIAFFIASGGVTMNKNDYVFLQIRNNTDSSNVTAETNSFFTIEER